MDIEDDLGEAQAPQRGGNDTPKLTKLVERIRKLNIEIKEAKMEIEEIASSAWEQCGYSGKAVKHLAKEAAWDAVERERRKQLEEEIDKGRVALGFLADTPLGQAELARAENERRAAANGTAAPMRRGRRRPPGSKNRRKPAAEHGDLPPAA
jgi:uncharacterized protein (UPF0335 family)